MLDTLPYQVVDGSQKDHDVRVYSLSTCGFCRKGLEYLNDHAIAYRYIYLDNIPIPQKKEVKNILKERYGAEVSFPFLTVDEKEFVVGFAEEAWQKLIGVSDE